MKKALKRSLSFLLAITIIFGSAYVGLGEIDFSVINFSGLFEIKAKAANEEYLKFLISDSGTYYSLSDCETVAEGEVIIPSTYSGLPVKGIAGHAFENCSLITSVVIPSSVTSIGYQAFYNCIKLESVNIPNSVKSLGGSVFENCESLKSVVIPDSVTSTNYYAFKNCKSLISVTIGKGLKIIDYAFFSGCTSLESVVIPSNITTIESGAFSNCTSLSSVVIGSNVKTIESSAFSYCTSLKTVNIPSSVTTLGERAFDFCSGLESFSVDSNNLYYTAYEGVLFNKSKTTLIHYPAKKENTSYTIPSTVVSTGWRAFCDADNLLSVDIPNNVKVLGRDAFFRCDNLVSVKLSNNITALQGRSFGECKSLESIVIPESVESIDSDEFQNCVSLSNVAFGSNVKSIDMRAFNGCTSLESIDLPDGVTSIGNEVFSGCTNLKYIDFGESLTTISEYACYNCSSLETVKIPASVTTIYKTSFRECSQFSVYITDIAAWAKITISGATDDDSSILYGRKLYLNGELAKNIVIPGTVTEIYKYAFSGCKSIETVEILDGVKTVGGFSRCSNLKSIKMADSVTAINFPFEFCGKLETIELSDSITSLPKYAFQFCNSLKSVVLPAKVTTLNTMCFYSCNSLESITIPKTLTVVNDFSFSSCSGLKYVFYEGSEDDWGQIEIGNYNEELEQATIHYNSTDHTYEWIDVASATCEAEGVKDYKCLYCNLQKDSVNIPALGHSFTEWTVNKEVTCESDGEKVRTCINCGKEELETTTAKGHEFSEWTVSKEPTCEAEGAKYRECTSCGETETEVISATGHTYSTEWTIDTEATCTTNGSKSHHCLNCGDKTDITVITALGHIVGEWVVTTEPTCSQEGEKVGYCAECGEACATEAVPTTEHNYDYDNYEYVINPDNSAEVVKEHKCKDCDATTLGNETFIAVLTVDELYNVRNNLSGKYVLMNDIDLTEATSVNGAYDFMDNGWNPIGSNNVYGDGAFSGTFDGNGYEISGMRIDVTTLPSGTSTCYLGLFANVTGVVKNLTVSGSINSNVFVYAGTIAGKVQGGTIENCISNCKMLLTNIGRVGGIAGYVCGEDSNIIRCANIAFIEGANVIGGIIGQIGGNDECAYDGEISQCYNLAKLKNNDICGGVIGLIGGENREIRISDCYNSGLINCNIIGSGIVGRYSSNYVYSFLYIENCYNIGAISGPIDNYSMVREAGSRDAVITNCYYIEGSGESQSGATALNDAMMQKQTAYTGFDFNSVWVMDTSNGYLYPQLRNNLHRGGCHHIYSDWVVDTEATCEADGSKHRTCESCGEVETEVFPATGHDYSTEWTIDTEATCTENGSKSHHCLNCGNKVDVTEIIATGHIVGEWVVTTEPTCSQEGEKVGYCAECGEACATEVVPTTEHNYDYDNYEYVQNPDNPDEFHKQYECEDCGSTKLDENSAVIKSLIIESLPDKTTYIEGQAIDTTGLVIKLEFEDGTTEVITDYDIVYDNSVTGEQDVTVSFGNVTASFKVTFTAKNLVSIAVTKMPDKTTYVIGDSFDRKGMVVTATYNNGLTEEVTGYTVSALPQIEGKKNLMVSFGGKRTIIQVTVIAKKAVSMTVIDPEKFEYVLGDEFDPTGMVVTVTFNNGAVEEVTDYTIEGFGDFTGVGYVTLKYEDLSYEIAILMHAPADFWVVESEATCTTDGLKHLYCTVCKEIAKSEVISATGHDCAETIIKEATCLEKGTKKFDCKHCDYSYTEEFGGGHIISGEKVTIEPTCEAEGVKYSLCSVCGETVGAPIAISALGHNYSDEFTVDVEATCSQPGSKSRHCTRCDAKTDVTAIDSSIHDYTDWVVTTPAGCETDGERTRSCTDCGEYFTETIVALGHAYSIIWTTDKTPTCTVDGSKSHHCNRCGDKKDITVIPATGHTFGEWVLLEEATCTVNGQRVRMCSTCYMEDVEILTAPGHTYGEWTIDANADCENDGARHTNCTVCGTVVNETIKAYGHDYESVFTVDKEATCTESGSKSHHCSRCEEKTDVTTILPLGHHISTMWTIDKDPTCESEGLKSHHCLRCDIKEEVTVIPVASHIFGKWYVVTEPTMEKEGVRAHKCYNCEMTEEAELPKLLKYTATFVADGEIVATVDFPEDATEIEVPEVPHKDKFNGEWENFDIRNKNFTVNAVYTPIPEEQIDGLTAGNKADYYSSTGEVEINLNVSAESKTIVTTTTKAVPLDIVFVLDQSGSMAEYGRKNALKNAVSSFSNAILEDAQKYSVDHRIAVVGFASGNNDGLNYGNTELLTSKTVKYNNITDADYKDALVYVNNDGALNSVISSAINTIDAEGATKADLGLEMASNIFANNPVTDNRQRVVVFLTDGVPTKYSSFEYSVANGAIQNAYQIKNTYDATIYSVGVFDRSTSADRSVNNFMNYVSSNYNEEVVMSRYSKETTENKNGYYLDVSDVSTLSDVFTSIVEETTTHTGRFSNATLKYTLTKYFTLTSVQEEAIRKNAMEKLGVTNEQISITRNADGTTTIVIKGVEPWADEDKFVIDFTFRATANGNTLKSGTYQVGTFESGVILENGEGYEAVFAPNSVDIGGTSGIAVFNINNIPYAINRLSSTTKVVAPATNFGEDYNFIGWNVPANLTLNNEVRVFDAELLKGEYKISWNIDGEITEVKYAVGDFIRVPHVGNNSIGGAFAGWDKEIPETMPSENLTITAVYDAHYHKYDVTKNFKNCEEGGTLTYTCACGDTYTEEIEACEHDWEVITASNNQNAIENAGSRCTVCGIKDSKALRLEGKDVYQESDASYNTATVELDYVDENGDKHQPDGDIEISVQLDEVFEQDVPVDATASVYRINDDGTRTMLPSEQNGMNITFETDHFSTYEFEYNTGDRRNIFAQKGTSIDYENKIIFSDTYLAKEFKSLVTYLIPSTLKTVKNEYGYFGTGAEMNLTKDSATESYKVIINGDLNGDGVCDVLDASYAALVASGKQTATEDEIYAANGEVADVIDVEDYQSVVNKVVA